VSVRLDEVGDVGVHRIRTAHELDAWEAAWSGGADANERVFQPALLDDEDVALFALGRGDRFAAGAVANRSGDIVGLSNFFARDTDVAALLGKCAAAAISCFPGRALVGYGGADELAALRRFGCDAIGPLRVWQKL